MAGPIQVSVDLQTAALHELDFLKLVYHDKYLRNPLVLANAIYRYEHLWLPFLKQHSQDHLSDLEYAPPIDIHWVWHAHMLSPLAYNKNCIEHFDRVFGHQLCSSEMLRQKRARTKVIWDAYHTGEPFEVVRSKPVPQRDQKPRLEYNLMDAVNRQQLFYYQVNMFQNMISFLNCPYL